MPLMYLKSENEINCVLSKRLPWTASHNPEMFVGISKLHIRSLFWQRIYFCSEFIFWVHNGIFLSLQFLKYYINLHCFSEHHTFCCKYILLRFLSLIFFMRCVGTSDSSAEHFTLKMDGNPTKRDKVESSSLGGFTLIVWNFLSQ